MNFEQWARATWVHLNERAPAEADHDYTQAEIKTVVAAAIEALIAELGQGGGLAIAGFGQVRIVPQKPRRVVSNLGDGKIYQLRERNTVRFMPSKALLNIINQNRPPLIEVE